MLLLASADIHSPRYLAEFRAALKAVASMKPTAFLLAGDLIEKGKAGFCESVIVSIKKLFDVPIYAVFGNEEYDEVKEILKKNCQVNWLDDEVAFIETGEGTLAIVGTRGSLDKPTTWQLRHVPGIETIYRERIRRVEELLREASSSADYVVLLTHYAPRCKTLKGEGERIWPYLSSSALARVIAKTKPHAVIHGHVHNSVVPTDSIEGVPVYNASLPAVKRIVAVKLAPRGLEAFF